MAELELQQVRSALRFLPAILAVVSGSDRMGMERSAKVRELLTIGAEQLLLTENSAYRGLPRFHGSKMPFRKLPTKTLHQWVVNNREDR